MAKKKYTVETYRQRCDCLGKDGMALDSIFSINGVFIPTPVLMSIRDGIKEYKKTKGNLTIGRLVKIRINAFQKFHDTVGETTWAAVDDGEYEIQHLRECIEGWIKKGETWEKERHEMEKKIKELEKGIV